MVCNKIFNVYKTYRFIGFVRLTRDLILSRTIFSGVRLIRYPWYIRGGDRISIGKGFTSGVGLRMDVFGKSPCARITIGIGVEVGDYVHIAAIDRVTIGSNCLLASKVFITDHDHGVYSGSGQSFNCQKQNEKCLNSRPVCIGNNVWIGEGVVILKGVSVGENSIIGAASVVVKNVPANVIVSGSPARIIKEWDEGLREWVSV
jgi:lipopolysaccharide O-acetyltransferase